MSEATEYVKKIEEMSAEERAKQFPGDPIPGQPLTDAQIAELDKRRLQADKRRRATEFSQAEQAEDAAWSVAANQFVIAHSSASAINTDDVKVRWSDANLHVLVSKAKQLGLHPSVGSLDFIFGREQENLCSHLEDELSQAEKDRIITRFLVQQKRLTPRYLRDNRGQTIDDKPEDILERAGYTPEEWTAAANSPQVQEMFRKNALTKNYTRLTDTSISHIAPQRAKQPTLQTIQLPDRIKSLTRNDLMKANSDQLKIWNSVPGAREYFAEVLARWRRGERP